MKYPLMLNMLIIHLSQEEYKDLTFQDETINKTNDPLPEADKWMMRSVKMDIPTLDKYVKRTSDKCQIQYFIPKQREVDIINPELKDKGIK